MQSSMRVRCKTRHEAVFADPCLKSNKRRARAFTFLLPALLATVLGAPAAQAYQDSAPFTTQLSIISGCAVTVADLDFGDVADLNTAVQASTTVNVNCSRFTPYLISFSSTQLRRTLSSTMAGPGTPVQYQLSLSASVGFGNRAYRIDGTVPIQPPTLPGIYTDTQRVYIIY